MCAVTDVSVMPHVKLRRQMQMQRACEERDQR